MLVRDNKLEGQNRVALLSPAGVVTPLTWPGTAPVDIEAIAAVPGQHGRYAVVTSAGAGRIVSVAGTGTGASLTVVRSFTLPAGLNQNEGFALTQRNGTTIAVWGNRGSVTAPGRLFAATFDPDTGVFGPFVKAAITVPYPSAFVRHISDTRVLDDGRIQISSTSDPGNNGPYASALYQVGQREPGPGAGPAHTDHARLAGHLRRSQDRGIRLLLRPAGPPGADDENLGGWVAATSLCG